MESIFGVDIEGIFYYSFIINAMTGLFISGLYIYIYKFFSCSVLKRLLK